MKSLGYTGSEKSKPGTLNHEPLNRKKYCLYTNNLSKDKFYV